MITIRSLARCAVLAATISTVGCAPAIASSPFGGGVRLGVSTGGNLDLSSPYCALTGSPSAEAGHARLTGAAMAFSYLQRAAFLQARAMFGGNQAAMGPESWKRLAAGGC